jgi:hypothetical protein
MGWKSLKEAYGITHIVKVEDDGIKIGSAYVGDLLTVKPDGTVIRSSILTNDQGPLSQVLEAMEEDRARLLEHLRATDVFERSLPVWTYENGRILELACEEHGWPNVTHDGRLMYENLFFEKREDAVTAAIRNAEYAVEGWTENVERAENDLAEKRARLARACVHLEAYVSQVGPAST